MPKTLYGVLWHMFMIHLLSTLLITLFTIALIKCSICHIICLFSFFHIITFIFPVPVIC